MATLSLPTNTPATDGAVIGCTSDTGLGTILVAHRTDRQWYSVSAGDSQIDADQDKSAITKGTDSAIVARDVANASLSPSVTVSGLEAGTYYTGWVQTDQPNYYVREDGTASDKASATGGSAAASMSMALVNSTVWAAGDTVVFDPAGGDFTLGLTVNTTVAGTKTKPVKFVGLGDGATIDLSALASGRCVSLSSVNHQYIHCKNLTLSGSGGSEVIYLNGGGGDHAGHTIKLIDITITDNTGGGSGGDMLHLATNSEVECTRLHVTDPVSLSQGCDVRGGASVILNDCTFIGTKEYAANYGTVLVNGGNYSGSTVATFVHYSAATAIINGANVSSVSGYGFPRFGADGGLIHIIGGVWDSNGASASLIRGSMIIDGAEINMPGTSSLTVMSGATLVVYNCDIDVSGAQKLVNLTDGTAIIERCKFDLRHAGAHFVSSGGTQATNKLIFNCNEVWGDGEVNTSGAIGAGTNGTILGRNNSIYNVYIVFGPHTSPDVKGELINNILHTCDATMDKTSMTTVDSNCCYLGAVALGGTNETTVDPLWINLTDNMRLDTGSPSRNTGADWWTTTVEGFARDRDNIFLKVPPLASQGAYDG